MIQVYICEGLRADYSVDLVKKHNARTKNGDIIFTDDMLQALGITDNYIDYFYKKYKLGDKSIEKALRLLLFYVGLEMLEDKEAGIETEQKYMYWWMNNYDFWNSPDVKQFKLHPDIEPSSMPPVKWYDIIYKKKFVNCSIYNRYFRIKQFLYKKIHNVQDVKIWYKTI